MSSTITIEDAEDRPWLAMVHGMSQDHRYFGKQVDAFRSRYRILLIDLPGHGLSSALGGPYGHAEFITHVERILETPRFGPVHYWGTHTGGTVGAYLGVKRLDLLRSLVLESPSVPGQNPSVVTDLISEVQAMARKDGVDASMEVWWNESPWFDLIRAHPERHRAAEHLAMVSGFSGKPWTDTTPGMPVEPLAAKTVPLPTIIYQGEYDHPDFGASAQDVGRLLAGSVHEILPDLGGFPAWEDPGKVNAIVALFLADAEALTQSFPPPHGRV